MCDGVWHSLQVRSVLAQGLTFSFSLSSLILFSLFCCPFSNSLSHLSFLHTGWTFPFRLLHLPSHLLALQCSQPALLEDIIYPSLTTKTHLVSPSNTSEESCFLWKKHHRNRNNRNPEDSCRNYPPSGQGRRSPRGWPRQGWQSPWAPTPRPGRSIQTSSLRVDTQLFVQGGSRGVMLLLNCCCPCREQGVIDTSPHKKYS